MADVKVRHSETQDGLDEGHGTVTPRGDYAPSLGVEGSEILRTSPFTLLRRFSQELDHAFTSLWGGRSHGWAPAVEVLEEGGKMVVRADLRGIERDDLRVEITENHLVLEGEIRGNEPGEAAAQHPGKPGKFFKAVPLPEGAQTGDTRAVLENGILVVEVPVSPQP